MQSGLTALLVALLFSCYYLAFAAKDSDRLQSAPPGFPAFSSNNYAGYITTVDNFNSSRDYYYWFVESQGNPSSDPLVLWLTGGPGCSGLLGLLQENGPITIGGDPEGFYQNAWSWSNIANVIYIDSPAGVGFSVDTPIPTVWNDNLTAQMTFQFLQRWLSAYPEYDGRDFYITGESYGGHYVPHLAYQIIHGDDVRLVKMMKGFMVGNPCTGAVGSDLDWCFTEDPTLEQYYKYHAMSSLDPRVKDVVSSSQGSSYSFFDEYDVLVRQCDLHWVNKTVRWNSEALRHARAEEMMLTGGASGQPPREYDACTDRYLVDMLNRDAVKSAINAKTDITWAECNAINYPTPPTAKGVVDIYADLMNFSNIKMLIYSGDADTVVNFIQTETIIASWHRPVLSEFQPWYYSDVYNSSWVQLGGYYVNYDRISWASVRGAGHMVPMWQPGPAYALFYSFLTTGRPGAKPPVVEEFPVPPPSTDDSHKNDWIYGGLGGLGVGAIATFIAMYSYYHQRKADEATSTRVNDPLLPKR
jgi:serine carboxypeptidase-like clade 2